MSKEQDKVQPSRNCRITGICPLNGRRQHQCMIYKAEVTTCTACKEYYGTSEGEFKSRYNNHTHFFRHSNGMELSKFLSMLKANGTDYHLKWSIKFHASQYKCGTIRCDLCLIKKMVVALADPKVSLNKRTELISKFCHSSKFNLNNV